jgi:hypothetical protein
MLSHGLDAWARSLSWCAHLPRPWLHELGASAADMAQPLLQRTAPSHHSHTQVLIALGGSVMVTGWIPDICCSFHWHLLQLTLPARHLHCQAVTLEWSTWHYCELLRRTRALKILIGKFSKLCELDYWNWTVLNVLHMAWSLSAWNSCMYICSALQGPARWCASHDQHKFTFWGGLAKMRCGFLYPDQREARRHVSVVLASTACCSIIWKTQLRRSSSQIVHHRTHSRNNAHPKLRQR